MLEFAALSKVCDVKELKDENHILVKEGLKRIQKGYNGELKALMEVNDIASDRLSAYYLGFVLGPWLNDTGWRDTAKRTLELLQNFTRADAYMLEQLMAEDKIVVIYLSKVHKKPESLRRYA